MRYVRTKTGHREFGVISTAQAAKILRPAGPIWLPEGIPGARGCGNLHCEGKPDRMKQLQGAGFTYFADFCEFVASDFDRICDARKGDLSLVRNKPGYEYHLIVRLVVDREGIRWDIVTGVPSRVCRDATLWP